MSEGEEDRNGGRRGSLERYRPGSFRNHHERDDDRRRGGGGRGRGDHFYDRSRDNYNNGDHRRDYYDQDFNEDRRHGGGGDRYRDQRGRGNNSGRFNRPHNNAYDRPTEDLRDKLDRQRNHQQPEDLRNRLNQKKNGNYPPKQLKKRNTENFDPSHAPPEMRILAAVPGLESYNRPYSTRDVLVVNSLFGDVDDLTIYNNLLKEIKESGVDQEKLWQLWHNDSHVIADDKRKWKESCPTFNMVLDKITRYFNMDVKATRLNWYRDSSEWKPFHHDAAAIKPKMARTQNFTAAVSFGAERDAAFEHAKTKTIISMPQPNGTIYTFGKDVNIMWKHGIPQLPPEKQTDEGRISIILWGWIDQFEL